MANFLSLEISPDLLAELQAAAAQVKKAVDQLPDDLPNAGRSRQNMGQASIGYVQAAHNAAKANPEVIPAIFRIDEMQKDLLCVEQVGDLLAVLEPQMAKLLNIRATAGQDLMNAANTVKKYFNSAAEDDAKYQIASDTLNKRYEKAKREKTEPPVNGGDGK